MDDNVLLHTWLSTVVINSCDVPARDKLNSTDIEIKIIPVREFDLELVLIKLALSLAEIPLPGENKGLIKIGIEDSDVTKFVD